MDSIETAFAALSRRMADATPDRAVRADASTPSISSLIAKVDAAKRSYQPSFGR